jgi:inhibitor of KinA
MATFRWYPIHDHAVTLAVNLPIGKDAFHLIRRLQKKATQQLPTLLNDLVPSYNSLTLIFKWEHTWTDHIKKIDGLLLSISNDETSEIEKETLIQKIPVCYEDHFAPDLVEISSRLNLAREKIVELHSSRIYQVYAMGFVPGFPYMGEIDEQLIVPRKAVPSQRIKAGSVAIANKQTGIYPFEVPGGWHVIGQTPLTLFNKNRTPLCLLQSGDQVQFFPISKSEFENWS